MSPVRPFEVRAEVMAAISPMAAADAPQVAALHHAAMGQSLWSRLGLPFLTSLYRRLVKDPGFLGYVYREEGEIRGFIAGAEDVSALYGRVFRRHFLPLGLRIAQGLINDPRVLRPLLETGRYGAVSDVDALVAQTPGESLFCSFSPKLRGRRIAGHINKVLFDELAKRGHHFVKITTETSNHLAIRQLSSWGFEDRGHFTFYGKEMVTYLLDLDASPRVSADPSYKIAER